MSMNAKKVSILIVNSNTKDVLKLCLENLKDSYENMEVIVCDNYSYDGSADMVEKDFSWVKLLRLPNNGIAFSLNKAVEVASGDYYLYLGPDAFPEKGTTIKGLVNYFETHSDVGGATVKLVLRSGDLDMDSHRGFPTPWVSFTHFLALDKLFPRSKTFAGYFMTYEDLTKEHEIDACITHFLFVRKSAQDVVGKWDNENFFVYGEDIDFCYRLKQAGFKLMYLPQFTSQHWKGVMVGVRKVSQDVASKSPIFRLGDKDYSRGDFRVMVHVFSTNAMEAFYNKHYRKKYPYLVTLWVIFTVRILRLLRTTKQRYLNYKNKIK